MVEQKVKDWAQYATEAFQHAAEDRASCTYNPLMSFSLGLMFGAVIGLPWSGVAALSIVSFEVVNHELRWKNERERLQRAQAELEKDD